MNASDLKLRTAPIDYARFEIRLKELDSGTVCCTYSP
jgi:hypothetical protein